MPDLKLVKITSCQLGSYWYRNKVGEIFEVELNYSRFGHVVYIDGERTTNNILSQDCRVLTEEEELLHHIEKKTKLLEKTQKTIDNLKYKLSQINKISEDDIVPGAEFKNIKTITAIFESDGRIRFGGVHDNKFYLYDNIFENRHDAAKYLNHLEYKKVNC